MLDSKGFDKWAGKYDKSIPIDFEGFPFEGYYDVLATVQNLAMASAGNKILDAGIGTALLSYELYKKGYLIYGLDFSVKMIEIARAKIPKGRFEIADISKDYLGKFSGEKFDKIISTYFFHHLDYNHQIEFILRATQNNLNPSGKIILGDIGFKSQEELKSAYAKYTNLWDDDEFYLCGRETVGRFKHAGLKAGYTQISRCGEVLHVSN